VLGKYIWRGGWNHLNTETIQLLMKSKKVAVINLYIDAGLAVDFLQLAGL